MSTLQVNRRYQAMSVADADAIYLRIARLKAGIDRETAAHKKRLADLEIAHKDKIAADLAAMEALEKELCAYILANPGRFTKPRKHPVGQIGSYGITTAPAYVRITDKEAFVDFALEQGYDDLTRVERTPDKDAALRRIMGGEEIPGAEVVPPGDVAKIAFKKGYAENLNA